MNSSAMSEKKPMVHVPSPNPPPSFTKSLTGSHYERFSSILMGQIGNALWTAHSEEVQQTQIDACAEALAGIAPQDEVEGLLAAQMIACHSAAMECFRHAMLKEQSPEGRQMYLNCANRLTRTYALHMETLDKHRGKGQQKVTVEHVHVYRGGQAIVGNVDTGGGGSNSKDQTHAQLTHAPEQEMRSALKEDREPVPERRNEKR